VGRHSAAWVGFEEDVTAVGIDQVVRGHAVLAVLSEAEARWWSRDGVAAMRFVNSVAAG
jgi:hypothetical protein